MLEFLVHFILVVVVSLTMIKIYHRFAVKKHAYSEVVGYLYVPSILLFVYGIIPIQIYFLDPSGLFAEKEYYLLSFVLMMCGAVAYIFGFYMTRRFFRQRGFIQATNAKNLRRYLPSFVVLIIVDAIFRFYSIGQGIYFSWMAALVRSEYEVDAGVVGQLMGGLGPLLGAISVAYATTHKWAKMYLAFLCLMVFLQGDRGILTYFFISVTFVWLHLRYRRTIPLKFIVTILLLLVIGYKVTLDMRIQFRKDTEGVLANPVAFLVNSALGSVGNLIKIGGEQEYEVIRGAGFRERTLMWSQHLALQLSAVDAGRDLIGVDGAYKELATIIPKVLWVWGGKPSLETGSIIASHFSIWSHTGDDPATTPFSSAYLFVGFFGLIIFGLVFGGLQRIVLSSSNNMLGSLSTPFYIGTIGFIVVRSNSFAGAFVGVRNAFFVLIMFYLVTQVICLLKRLLADNGQGDTLNQYGFVHRNSIITFLGGQGKPRDAKKRN